MSSAPAGRYQHLTAAHQRAAGRKRASQFTREHQAAAGRKRASQFTPEYQRAAGRIAYQVLIERYGPEQAREMVFSRRPERRPSSLEQTVAGWLAELGLAFQREHTVDLGSRYAVFDFYFEHGGRQFDLETDGQRWHTLPGRHEYDERRDAQVAAGGYVVIRLSQAGIESGAAKAELAERLALDDQPMEICPQCGERVPAGFMAYHYSGYRRAACSQVDLAFGPTWRRPR